MMEMPSGTRVHRLLPKEAFYKHLQINRTLKEKFVSDVEHIFVENILANSSLNLTGQSEIKEIMLLLVKLKKQEFDGRLIEAIARQNQHKLVFLFVFGEMRQLALYRGKLYLTPWLHADDIELKLQGDSLDEIWNGFIEQIALYEEKAVINDALSVEERLARQEQITKLEKLISKTEAAAWREKQPKKKFEIYTQLREYKKLLEELKNGTS